MPDDRGTTCKSPTRRSTQYFERLAALSACDVCCGGRPPRVALLCGGVPRTDPEEAGAKDIGVDVIRVNGHFGRR
ncbi:hypothetical protein [Streptomyces broussonetiae]|uniref:hypothetical protein n=1 Tax=Streptomyces broussonetiae TaxID=2686304 RepID=UPI0035DC3DB9